jgi:hypothetical protein
MKMAGVLRAPAGVRQRLYRYCKVLAPGPEADRRDEVHIRLVPIRNNLLVKTNTSQAS